MHAVALDTAPPQKKMQQKWLRMQTSPTQLSVNLFKFEIKS